MANLRPQALVTVWCVVSVLALGIVAWSVFRPSEAPAANGRVALPSVDIVLKEVEALRANNDDFDKYRQQLAKLKILGQTADKRPPAEIATEVAAIATSLEDSVTRSEI